MAYIIQSYREGTTELPIEAGDRYTRCEVATLDGPTDSVRAQVSLLFEVMGLTGDELAHAEEQLAMVSELGGHVWLRDGTRIDVEHTDDEIAPVA